MPDTVPHTNNGPRLTKAYAWLESLGIDGPRLSPVAGDASARRYFRIDYQEQSRLLMDSPPASEPLEPFIKVSRILHAADLPAPEIFAADTEQGFLLLQDFGDRQLRDVLDTRSVSHWWPRVFELLTQMTTETSTRKLPDYSPKLLHQELDLFPDWYLDCHLNAPLSPAQRTNWNALCKMLTDSAEQQPQVFVHRDFHSCNLMVTPAGNLGLIDYQDAVRGPVSYDLMSILLDRYITWPRDLLEGWMQLMRRQLAPDISRPDWIHMCDWMGLQRNLKIIGIFARLCHRDGKAHYLELIPRFAGYVLDTSGRYPELGDAHRMLSDCLEPSPKEVVCTP